MALEIMPHGGGHGGGHHGGGGRPTRGRFWGGGYPYYSGYTEPYILEVDRSQQTLPYRVVVFFAPNGMLFTFYGATADIATQNARAGNPQLNRLRASAAVAPTSTLQHWNGASWQDA